MPLDGASLDFTGRMMLDAADRIERCGLAKFEEYDSAGHMCWAGALRMAFFNRPDDSRVCFQEAMELSQLPISASGVIANERFCSFLRVVAKRMGHREYYYAIDWNNSYETTAEDVVKALREHAYAEA